VGGSGLVLIRNELRPMARVSTKKRGECQAWAVYRYISVHFDSSFIHTTGVDSPPGPAFIGSRIETTQNNSKQWDREKKKQRPFPVSRTARNAV